ncbi:MAG: glycosyltransferase family A protein [Methylococcaceae bacterium]|jgi:glycosyltransferase involved in cell wall biosynthesis
MTALISVIMPCYNAEQYLHTGIASVFGQTYPNLELIVVNDGSTDNSLAILQALNDPRLQIINQTNQGVCGARNQGLQAANGDFIAFLDADDTWHPDCLSKLYQALQDQPTAVLAYCGWQNIGLPGGQGQPYIPQDLESGNKRLDLFTNCCWPIHACLSQKQAIFAAQRFDPRLVTSEDYLLWLKIGARHHIARVPEVLAFYHFHDGHQATQNKAKTALNHWLAQQLFIDENIDLAKTIGLTTCKQIMRKELLHRGLECYWKRDLQAARIIFRKALWERYAPCKYWPYMLPAMLPYSWHQRLLSLRD